MIKVLLCEILAYLRAQGMSYQTSHWQVSGDDYYGNHLLFQRLYESSGEEVDVLAEKIVGYFGSEAADISEQIDTIQKYVKDWGRISCHHERGLKSEQGLQRLLKMAYDSIKATGQMTLGLDDWIMATASSHEGNQYLLQQALSRAPNGGRRQASKAFRLTQSEINRADRSVEGFPFTIISRPQTDGSYMVAAVNPDTGLLVFSHAIEYAGDKSGVPDAVRRLNRNLDKNTGLSTNMTNRSRHQHLASRRKGFSGAHSAEGDFYDNPLRREVLEFSESGAISNVPEVAKVTPKLVDTSESRSHIIKDMEDSPPTPTEILEEPGGESVGTLNRLVVESEDPEVEPAAVANEARMAKWLRQLSR